MFELLAFLIVVILGMVALLHAFLYFCLGPEDQSIDTVVGGPLFGPTKLSQEELENRGQVIKDEL